MKFRLLTYLKEENVPRAGLLVEEQTVLDVQAVLAIQRKSVDGLDPTSVLSLLDNWDELWPILREAAAGTEWPVSATVGPLSDIQLAAPILYPPTIYCAAANYADHSREMSKREPPDKRTTRPFFFIKASQQTVIGPEQAIRIPHPDAKIDWEAELGVVISSRCRGVSTAEAMNYVAGYTIIHDVSDRSRNFREDWNFRFDWFGGKSFDTSAPMGPWITPREFVSDPHDLAIRLWVNNELMQNSSSRFMHFTIPEQIEYLSGLLTLLPGDVIVTGTPAGVGHPRNRYLKPGDTVRISIDELGSIRNPVIAGY